MTSSVIFLGIIAATHAAVFSYNHPVTIPADKFSLHGLSGRYVQFNIPSEITNVVGPSGSIQRERYLELPAKTFAGLNPEKQKVFNQFSNEPLKKFSIHGTDDSLRASEKVRILGPSGSITQETVSNSNAVPSSVIPNNVQYGYSPVAKVAVPHGSIFIGSSSDETKIKVPVTYGVPLNVNEFHAKSSDVAELDLALIRPVSTNYRLQSFQKDVPVHAHNGGSILTVKTSIIGPSGSIAQEIQPNSNKRITKIQSASHKGHATTNTILLQHESEFVKKHPDPCENSTVLTSPGETGILGPSASKHNVESYKIVQSTSPSVKPVTGIYGLPSAQNFDENNGGSVSSEKSILIGPSGAITHEIQSGLNEYASRIQNVINTAAKKPEYGQYEYPAAYNFVLADTENSASIPVVKSNAEGSSGSIIRGNHLKPKNSEKSLLKIIPVNVQSSARVVHYGFQPKKYFAFAHEGKTNKIPIENTDFVGPSSFTKTEKFFQPTGFNSPSKVYGDFGYTTGGLISQEKQLQQAVGTNGYINIYSTHPIPTLFELSGPENEIYVPHVTSTQAQDEDCVESNDLSTQEQNSQSSRLLGVRIIQQNSPKKGTVSLKPSSNTLVARTSIIGPSGSIKQDIYSPAFFAESSTKTNHDLPIAYSSTSLPISVVRGTPLSKNIYVEHGNEKADFVVGKTSIIGPSGSITQEYNSKSVLTHLAQDNDVSTTSSEVIPYDLVESTTPLVEKNGDQENLKNYGPSQPIPKYPNIAAPEC